MLRYVVLTEGAIDDALEALCRTRPAVRTIFGCRSRSRKTCSRSGWEICVAQVVGHVFDAAAGVEEMHGD